MSLSVDQSPASVGDCRNGALYRDGDDDEDFQKKQHKRLKFAIDGSHDSNRNGSNVVTPRFWDKAATRAVETLGTLSPGSRRRLSKVARSGDSPSKKESSKKDGRKIPDLLLPVSVLNSETPLEDLPSALEGARSFAAKNATCRDGDDKRRGHKSASMNRPSSRGDLLSATGSKPSPSTLQNPKSEIKKRRPPRLQIMSDTGTPLGVSLLGDEAGTPLLRINNDGGHVVGEVPGLRSGGKNGSKTLRKAVLERWGGTPRSPALTPNDHNATMSPTQFLTTPR
ncbi:hypothetical protein N9L76_06555 [bacterium]|nr:hypothetical protein [bacterium]